MLLLGGENRLFFCIPVAAQGLEPLLSIAVGPGGQGIRCLIVARILHQEEAAHTQNHGCRSSGKADPHRLSGGGRLAVDASCWLNASMEAVRFFWSGSMAAWRTAAAC